MRQQIIHQDGEVYFDKDFFNADKANTVFSQLKAQIHWKEEVFTLFGKTIVAPRLVGWYGDKQAVYTYSGIKHQPLPWITPLKQLKMQIETATGHTFNSVLANLYRDGEDSMGWHADKEKELGINPVIVSLSFGDMRRFNLRHNKRKEIVYIELTHGSMLLMQGKLQHHWQHSVPKTKKAKTARINLTFRNIADPQITSLD